MSYKGNAVYELRKALGKARLPDREHKLADVLIGLADFETGLIPDKYQPGSLDDLAKLCGWSKAKLCRVLDISEDHGWLLRGRHENPGRGQNTAYQILPKGLTAETLLSGKGSQFCEEKGLSSERVRAGQTPFSAERQREEKVEREVLNGSRHWNQDHRDADHSGGPCDCWRKAALLILDRERLWRRWLSGSLSSPMPAGGAAACTAPT